MIEVIPQDKSSKLGTIDFSRLLHRPDTDKALHWDRSEFTKVSGVKDEDIISACEKAIENKDEVNLDYAIKNTDRAVTTMLSGVIAKRYGEEGLPDSTINIKFKGSAGQSFGAFAVSGINVRLEGEANDYLRRDSPADASAFCPHHVRAPTSWLKTISLPATLDSTERQVASCMSTAVWASVSACAIQEPQPSSKVPATIAVSI